jgi:hypothetical protein
MTEQTKQTFYFVRPTEKGPKLFSLEASWNADYTFWDFGLYFSFWGGLRYKIPGNSEGLFTDPDDAMTYFEKETLAQVAQLRAEAEFLMNNLKILRKEKRRELIR